ncbi:LysM peptidoglycan-binding domain-containing protein [Aquipuribacter sp. MA13-6]
MAVSVVAVLAPAGGALTAGWQATQLVASGAAAAHWADALLLLSCLGCVALLVWGTAAAVAGVRDGWRTAATGRTGPTAATAPVRGPAPGSGSRAAGPSGPDHRPTGGHVVAATVAALVVAALSAGPATASATGAPPVAVATATSPASEPSPGGEPSRRAGRAPGTWTALAEAVVPPATGAATTGTTAAPSPPAADPTPTADPTAAPATVEPFRAPRGVDPASAALVTGTTTRPALQRDPEVVVRAGDTLWDLAAEHLGPGATDDEVARAWPSWWQANRAVVGDDPDLLLPGQRLVVPAP